MTKWFVVMGISLLQCIRNEDVSCRKRSNVASTIFKEDEEENFDQYTLIYLRGLKKESSSRVCCILVGSHMNMTTSRAKNRFRQM